MRIEGGEIRGEYGGIVILAAVEGKNNTYRVTFEFMPNGSIIV